MMVGNDPLARRSLLCAFYSVLLDPMRHRGHGAASDLQSTRGAGFPGQRVVVARSAWPKENRRISKIFSSFFSVFLQMRICALRARVPARAAPPGVIETNVFVRRRCGR